jgi:hypothetical protein
MSDRKNVLSMDSLNETVRSIHRIALFLCQEANQKELLSIKIFVCFSNCLLFERAIGRQQEVAFFLLAA